MRESRIPDLAAMLSGGTRRSIGRSEEAAAIAFEDAAARMSLVRLLDHDDPLVRMRAADALEKMSAKDPALIQGYKRHLLGLLARETQQEVRWHLAQMAPRLSLTDAERAQAFEDLKGYLSDQSVIVQAWALTAIAEIATSDARFEAAAERLLTEASSSDHAAMRARAKALRLEREHRARPQSA